MKDPMNRALLLAPLALALACQSQQAAVQQPTAPAEARTAPKKCDEVALALAPDDVVATVDGQPVTAKELGDELADAEKSALRDYCNTVSEVRRIALENHLRESLVEKAAKAAGKDVETFLRERVEAAVKEPSEEELAAFYKANSRPDAPPLEEIKPAVVAAMQRDQRGKAVEELLEELMGGAKIERKLPDVRPPAIKVDIAEHTATAGAAEATVEVVEYADFECPYCQVMAMALKEAKTRMTGKSVRFAYRHFPLSFHPNARPAAEFSQCANEQGKFWEMHDAIYAQMDKMDPASLLGHAEDVGLDSEKLQACLAAGRGAKQVDADLERGKALGVEGTPTLYINGRLFQGQPSGDAIVEAIEAELAAGG
jgi:protein-disulfide isomerase